MVIDKVREKEVEEKLIIDEGDVKNYYLAHKEDYKDPNQAMKDIRSKRVILLRQAAFLFALGLILCGCKIKKKQPQDLEKTDTQQLPAVEVKAVVDNPTPVIGEIITYTLTVDAIPEISPKIPEMGAQISGLRIVDIGGEGPKLIDGRHIWKRWYKMQADLVGSYIIPSAQVTFQDPKGEKAQASAPQIFIEVKSGMKEGEEAGDIRDIKPLEKPPSNLLGLYLFAGCGILLLILVGIGIWLWLRKKKGADVQLSTPADEVAFGELDRLMASKHLENKNYRYFYFRLSEILRTYIKARFGFPAQESTTEELIPRIENLKLTRTQKDTIRLLIRWEDLVKFAQHIPTDEKAKKDWEQTRQLILETRDANEGVA